MRPCRMGYFRLRKKTGELRKPAQSRADCPAEERNGNETSVLLRTETELSRGFAARPRVGSPHRTADSLTADLCLRYP